MHINDICFIFEVKNGKILQMNQRALDFYGYNNKDLSKVTVFDLNSLNKSIVMEEIDKVLMRKEHHFNFKHKTKTGVIKDIEVYAVDMTYQGKQVIFTQIKDLTEDKIRRNFFDNFINNSPYAVAILDSYDRFEKINEDFKKLFGYNSMEVLQKTPGETIHNSEKEFQKVRMKVREQRFIQEKGIRYHKNGEAINVEMTVFPIYYNEKISKIAAIYRDIRIEKKLYNRLEKEAKYDALTGVYNRRYGIKKLKYLYQKSSNDHMELSIIYFDINGLKALNDELGHLKGDELITIVTDVLKDNKKDEEILCRLGGDEFLMIMPKVDKETLKKRIEEIEEMISQKNEVLNLSYTISVAMGGTSLNDKFHNIDDMLKKADHEMYKDKINKKRKDRI